jgi:hypothetical protein
MSTMQPEGASLSQKRKKEKNTLSAQIFISEYLNSPCTASFFTTDPNSVLFAMPSASSKQEWKTSPGGLPPARIFAATAKMASKQNGVRSFNAS